MKIIRSFNKHILNPITRHFAQASFGPFALVYHIGRRTGKPYETPIIAIRLKDGFMIALTYGTHVDWYQNVLAAESCTLQWHKKKYALNQLTQANAENARKLFPQPLRTILKINGTPYFVKLHDVATTAPSRSQSL